MNDDRYITRDMLTEESYEGNNFAEGNAVKYDLQNGKINTVAFCICPKTAEDMAKSLNLLDHLEQDGIELKQQASEQKG